MRRFGGFGVAVLCALLSCGDKKAENVASSATAAPAVVEPAPQKELTTVAMPAETVAVFGVDQPRKILDQLSKIVASVQPGGISMEQLLAPKMADAFRITGMDGVDLSKPVRGALLDPKKRSDAAMVVAVTVTSKDKFLASAPASKKQNVEGNQYSWEDRGKQVFVNFVGEQAFVSFAQDIFPTHREFLRQLGASTIQGDALAIASAEHATKLYGADIDRQVTQMKAMAENVKDDNIKSGMLFLGGLAQLLRELDRATLSLQLPDDGFLAKLKVAPKPGTELEKTLGALKSGGPSPLLAKIPSQAPVVLAGSISPQTLPLLEQAFSWFGRMSGGSAGSAFDMLAGASKGTWSASSGHMALALFQQEGVEGPHMLSLAGVTDPDKMREAARKVAALMQEGDFKKVAETAGWSTSYQKAAYKLGTWEVDVQKKDFSKAAPALKQTMGLLSGEGHFVVTQDLSIAVTGPNPKQILSAFVDNKVPGGFADSARFRRTKQNAVADPIFVVMASPSDMLGGAAKGMLAPGLPPSGGDAPPIALSIGAAGSQLELGLDIPTVQVAPTALGLGMLQQLILRGATGAGQLGPRSKGAPPPSLQKP